MSLLKILLILVVISSSTFLASCSSWNQAFSDPFFSNTIPDYFTNHASWLSLNSPSLSAMKLSLDPNSMLFAVNSSQGGIGQLLMIMDHSNSSSSLDSYLASVSAENGLWKILMKLPFQTRRPLSAMNNVLTALYDSVGNNYFVVRMCGSSGVDANSPVCLVKISLQNLQSMVLKFDSSVKMVGGLVLSNSVNTILVSTNSGFYGIDISTMTIRFSNAISTSLSSLGNVILVSNEEGNGIDYAYATLSYTVYRINMQTGHIASSISFYSFNAMYMHVGYMEIPGYVTVLIVNDKFEYFLSSGDLLKNIVGKSLSLSNFGMKDCSMPIGKLDMAIADRYFFKSSVLCSNYSSNPSSSSSRSRTSTNTGGGVYFLSFSIGAARVGQIPKLGEPYIHYELKKDLIFTHEIQKKHDASEKTRIPTHLLASNVYLGPIVSVSKDHSVVALSNLHSYDYVDYMNKVIVKTVPKQYAATTLAQFAFYSLGNGKFYACTLELDCQAF
ncbi:hypothetical protein C9374_002514 [Naegleria lovaniensis]|uniref:Uncharacterized protein n=1 Tax=Naegleria lovaniensis TaxID=51637 RepID=A0AA88KKG8_NAELO|nr:uncharacterized protein C9374_002514 [Naegleria lovaniensis]KAG2386770.1 hypothetical protein C9374_002514 [Naegleria lovaniensis]